MAGDSDVIREFLVRLGFQVNETGNKKFDGALLKTGNVAAAAGKTLIGVGLAAQAMVAAYAASMEKLYYASRRTGASVENIQALESGSRRIGLAAGEAQGALEAMAAAVRTNPGLRGLMDQLLGKDSSKMDQAKAMVELVQRLSNMPHYIGSQFAGMFGIDEKTFLMLKQGMPDLIKGEEKRIELNRRAGINADDAAKAAKEYANSLRDISDRVGVLVDKISIELLPAFKGFNDKIIEIIDTVQSVDFSKLHMPETTKEMKELGKAADFFLDTWKGIANSEIGQNFFSNLKKDAEGASKGILEMLAGLAYLASGEWKKGGAMVLSGLKNQAANSAPAAAARGAFDWINTWRDSYRDVRAPSSEYNGESPAEAATRRSRAKASGAAAPAPSSTAPSGPKGVRNNNPGNLEFHGQRGATSDGRFAKFGTANDGLEAMAAQLDRYNTQGINTIAKVINKWAPPKKKDGSFENNTAAYIDDISKKMGVAPGDKLDLKDAAVLSKLMGSIIGHENGSNPYNEYQLLGAAQARVGDGGVTITQQTDIHVAAGPTAVATGAEVGRVQNRVNGDIVRNLQGAIR